MKDIAKARVQLDQSHNKQLADRRKTFFQQLMRFRALQDTYMPGVRMLVNLDEEEAAVRGTPILAEAVKLWLPSQISGEMRASVGRPTLYEMEASLRRAQLSTSLHHLRIRLHAKRHLIMFRNAYLRGQRKTGRARSLIDSVSDKVDGLARKYREARAALVCLVGESSCGEFHSLNKEDVTMRYVQDHDAKAARRLAKIAGRPTQNMTMGDVCEDEADKEGAEGAEERGASRRTMSWIWTAQGAPEESDEYLHESEWCQYSMP